MCFGGVLIGVYDSLVYTFYLFGDLIIVRLLPFWVRKKIRRDLACSRRGIFAVCASYAHFFLQPLSKEVTNTVYFVPVSLKSFAFETPGKGFSQDFV